MLGVLQGAEAERKANPLPALHPRPHQVRSHRVVLSNSNKNFIFKGLSHETYVLLFRECTERMLLSSNKGKQVTFLEVGKSISNHYYGYEHFGL